MQLYATLAVQYTFDSHTHTFCALPCQ